MTDSVNPIDPLHRAAQTPDDPRRHRVRVFTVSGLATAAVLGGAATAYAASGGGMHPSTPSTPPASSSTSDASPAPGRPAGPGARQHPVKHLPHLDGTVTRAADGTITITDHDGFTRSINVTAATAYTGGLTSTPATGTRIHAEGAIAADGTSLDATSIRRQPQPHAGGPAHHVKPGHAAPKAGGPAGHAKPTPGAAGTGTAAGPGKPDPGTSGPGKPAAPSGTPSGPAPSEPAPAPSGPVDGS